MKNEKHPLDEFFKEGLSEHKLKPSSTVWEKIEAAQPATEKNKKGGWYVMRAAVVVLLIGLSSVLYYQNNPVDENWAVHPDNTETDGPDKEKTNKDKEKTQTEVKSSKTETDSKKSKKEKRAVPIMRQNAGRQIYVANDEVTTPVDEADLQTEEELLLADIDLKVESTPGPAPIKVKFKVTPKAATQGFYANREKSGEEKKDFKDKLYAYASSQFDNIKNGKPVELPKPEKKPQLEIDLGKFF